MNFRSVILILNLLHLIHVCYSNNCTNNIPHGQVGSCFPARICSYTCFEGYKKHDDIDYIACSLSGQWLTFAESTVEDLCTRLPTTTVSLLSFSATQVTLETEASRCPVTILNGQISSTNCSRLRFSTCSDFMCNPGFQRFGTILHCNSKWKWSYVGEPCVYIRSEYHPTWKPRSSNSSDGHVIAIVVGSILGLPILVSILTYAWRTRCRTRLKSTGTGNNQSTTTATHRNGNSVIRETAHIGHTETRTHRDEILGHTATGTRRNDRAEHFASANAVYSVQTNEHANSQLNNDFEHQPSRHSYSSVHIDGPPEYSTSAISVQSEPNEALPSYEPPPPYEPPPFYEQSPLNEPPRSNEPSSAGEPQPLYERPPSYEPTPCYHPPPSYQPPPSY